MPLTSRDSMPSDFLLVRLVLFAFSQNLFFLDALCKEVGISKDAAMEFSSPPLLVGFLSPLLERRHYVQRHGAPIWRSYLANPKLPTLFSLLSSSVTPTSSA